MARLILLATVLSIALYYKPVRGSKESSCRDEFQKIGCFEERSPNYANLLFNDRNIITWNDIEPFIRSISCKCNKKTREANKARSDKFVGYAIHNWGECFGKTQADIDAVGLKEQTHRCTGDQSYSGCKNEHAGCVGHDFADYIYLLSVEAEKDVDGGYSEWESWTPCKGKCGTGLRARERTCTNPLPQGKGKDCSSLGNSTEVEECELPILCPVDGEYGSWSEYIACSKSCGGGIQTRTRKCDSPPPDHGGKPCDGPSSETRNCSTQKCPVDGQYGAWGPYQPCSKSCGGGMQERTRECNNPAPSNGGKPCSGPSSETRNCNTAKCQGVHGAWGPYGPCSKSCGGGVQERNRNCSSSDHYCSGPSSETRSCNTQKCPVDGGYSSWSSYSPCSKSCGGGIKTRRRYCNNPSPKHGGKSCSRLGSSSSTARCNAHECLSREYFKRACEWRSIYIRCPGSSRITITYALYGRKTWRYCRRRNRWGWRWGRRWRWRWSRNCRATSSYSKVGKICEGKKTCRVYAKNKVFGDPCRFTRKYLEIKYRCKG